ncbi:MAG: hypothetical protein NZM09_04260 [Ignavibacterium sp.]|nr:hypothetical protein [Ignavibacterium sp.]MDW8374891.1 hypothetical protein [Ignavibacteriales bacterium]
MKNILSIIIFSTLFISPTLYSQDYAAALKLSTTGITAEAIRSFSPNFNARLGFSFFSYSVNGGGGTGDDYSFDAKLGLFSISALADYFPFERGLKLTAGFVVNLNKFEANMKPARSYTVGGDVYTPALLGTMNANISFNKIAPYIGIGFGNPTAGSKGLGFSFDIGTIYQGPPKAKLSASGLIEPSASPEQQKKFEENLSWFKWFPVFSFGLTYKF